jgi:hypothetical protein
MAFKCKDWPHCSCARRWVEWQSRLTEWNDPSEPAPVSDATDWALWDIYMMLACVGRHGPPSQRRWAMAQMMMPVFQSCAVEAAAAQARRLAREGRQ